MSKNPMVGSFPASKLAALFGGAESFEIRKSAREGAKYPLYLSTPRGPVHVNTPAGQNVLLELGTFKGAEQAKPAEKVPPGFSSDPKPEPVKPAEPAPKPPKKTGFWDRNIL